MSLIHHGKLPEHSTLLSGRAPPDDIGFRSDQLQIWYNNTDESWVGNGETPHFHRESDECFIVLKGAIEVEVEGVRTIIGEWEFCCFPVGLYHAVIPKGQRLLRRLLWLTFLGEARKVSSRRSATGLQSVMV